jgi:PAS domain-containing protein
MRRFFRRDGRVELIDACIETEKNVTPISRQSRRKSKDNLVHRKADSLRRNSAKDLRKLRARSAVLEKILHDSPAAILLVDSVTGKILEINQAAEKILEISGSGAPDNSFHVRNIFVQKSEFDSLQKEILDQKKS